MFFHKRSCVPVHACVYPAGPRVFRAVASGFYPGVNHTSARTTTGCCHCPTTALHLCLPLHFSAPRQWASPSSLLWRRPECTAPVDLDRSGHVWPFGNCPWLRRDHFDHTRGALNRGECVRRKATKGIFKINRLNLVICFFTMKALKAAMLWTTHQKVQKQRKCHLHTRWSICELILMGLDIMITTAAMSYKINKQLSLCLIIVYFHGFSATDLSSKRRGVRCKDTLLTACRLFRVANEPLLACYLNCSDYSGTTGYTFTDWGNGHRLWCCHVAWFLMTDRLFVVARMRSEQQIVGGRDFTRTS